MAIIGSILTGIGGIICAVGAIWLLVKAFQQSILWGLGSLFIPFVIIVYAIMFWADAKKPFLIYLAGVGIVIVGVILTIVGAPPMDTSSYMTPTTSP